MPALKNRLHLYIVIWEGAIRKVDTLEEALSLAVPDFYILGDSRNVFDPVSLFSAPTVRPLIAHIQKGLCYPDGEIFLLPVTEKLRQACLNSGWKSIPYQMDKTGRANVVSPNNLFSNSVCP